jgi:hypothetical protein
MVVDIYLIRLSDAAADPATLSFSKREKSRGDYHDPDKILMRQFGFVFPYFVNVDETGKCFTEAVISLNKQWPFFYFHTSQSYIEGGQLQKLIF